MAPGVRVHGRALYKQASTQSLQTLAFTENSFLGLNYTCLKKGKRKSYIVTGSAAHMSRIKDIGIWNPRIRVFGIRNPGGWNPESRGWILLHGAIQASILSLVSFFSCLFVCLFSFFNRHKF